MVPVLLINPFTAVTELACIVELTSHDLIAVHRQSVVDILPHRTVPTVLK
jgi:hypothetical protein